MVHGRRVNVGTVFGKYILRLLYMLEVFFKDFWNCLKAWIVRRDEL
jgi:hypothetical protein